MPWYKSKLSSLDDIYASFVGLSLHTAVQNLGCYKSDGGSSLNDSINTVKIHVHLPVAV